MAATWLGTLHRQSPSLDPRLLTAYWLLPTLPFTFVFFLKT